MTRLSTNPSFHGNLDLLRQGDDAAATWIWNRYVVALVSFAQERLHKRLQRKVDAEDVVNSVFKSFFFGFRKGQFDLPNPESLWGLLAKITVRKCCKQHKHFMGRACRSVDREMAIEQDGQYAQEPIDHDSTPSAAVRMTETLREVLHDFNSLQREIVDLRMAGWSTREISQQTGCTRRRVQRVLQRVKSRLQDMIDQPCEE